MRARVITITGIAIIIIAPSLSQVFHKNHGESQSIGSISNGQLINGYKIPYKGDNYKFFSAFDYYILGRCYIHSDIYKILLDTYDILEDEAPGYRFRLMESSKRKGGRPYPHRTHQNGTSIDFMTPLKMKNEPFTRYDRLGLLRYLINFDENGQHLRKPDVEIDFDLLALHILTLEKVANDHGYKIAKVILETNLKDEIFKSKHGKRLKNSHIYFVKSLPVKIDKLHDDHYHIDFCSL